MKAGDRIPIIEGCIMCVRREVWHYVLWKSIQDYVKWLWSGEKSNRVDG